MTVCSACSYSRRARLGLPAATHMSPSGIVVSSASTKLPAACRLRTASKRGQRLFHVPGGPGGQAEIAVGATAYEVVLWSGQVQGVPGMAHGTGDIAACLRQRRSVDVDRRRRGAQVFSVSPRCREVLVLSAGRQRRFGVVESIRPRRGHRTSSATSWTGCRGPGFGAPLASGKDRTQLISRVSCRVGRICGIASMRYAARSKSSAASAPDGVHDQAASGEPVAGAHVEIRQVGGVLGEQAGVQHVGEQVVVAVPGALGVERDNEEVLPLEVRQRPGRRCRR